MQYRVLQFHVSPQSSYKNSNATGSCRYNSYWFWYRNSAMCIYYFVIVYYFINFIKYITACIFHIHAMNLAQNSVHSILYCHTMWSIYFLKSIPFAFNHSLFPELPLQFALYFRSWQKSCSYRQFHIPTQFSWNQVFYLWWPHHTVKQKGSFKNLAGYFVLIELEQRLSDRSIQLQHQIPNQLIMTKELTA